MAGKKNIPVEVLSACPRCNIEGWTAETNHDTKFHGGACDIYRMSAEELVAFLGS